MDPYNFWQDLLDTYQSLSVWMQSLWLVFPPAVLLGLVAVLLRSGKGRRAYGHTAPGTLVYTIYRDDEDHLHVFSHARQRDDEASMLLFETISSDHHMPLQLQPTPGLRKGSEWPSEVR